MKVKWRPEFLKKSLVFVQIQWVNFMWVIQNQGQKEKGEWVGILSYTCLYFFTLLNFNMKNIIFVKIAYCTICTKLNTLDCNY